MSDSRAIAVPGDRVGIACDRTGIGRGRKSIIAAEAYPSGWPETDAQNGNDRRSRYGRFLTLAAFGVLVMAGSVNAVAQPAEADYRDPEQAPAVRAADLVSRMTLEEKAAQLQSAAPAVERLQIPAYHWWNEGLHGVARADEATVFPQAIGMAATWNPDLLKSVGDVVSTEFRAKFLKTVRSDGSSSIYRGLTVWSPNVNIFRDPRWGRGQETYGEDPLLASRMGVAYIQGLQGPDPDRPKVVATIKHLAVHSGPEADRHREDVHVRPRDLVETYLPAFHAAVTEGQVQSLMCAYNAVDGVPACASKMLLQDFLRRDWGFNGFVVSDCGAVADIYMASAHRYVATQEEAVAAALKAGTDVMCEFGNEGTADPRTTVKAVKQGLLTEQDIDRALTRGLEARFRLGLLNRSQDRLFPEIAAIDYDTPAHRAVALEMARQSLVLLKNDGLLPLKTAPRRIAVIGPNADSVEALVGNYNGTPTRPATILAGLKTRFPDAAIEFVEGTGWVGPPLHDVPETSLCVDAQCKTPGLTLEQFGNTDLSGKAEKSERISRGQFRWGWPDNFDRRSSTRWTGYIRAGESGIHNFRIKGQTGYRIFIDGKMVADMWDIAWPTSKTEIALEAGKTYALRVEARQTGYSGEQTLQWSPPSSNDEAALTAARNADLVVFAGGLTAELEGEEMAVHAPGFSGGDRTSLDLPAPQQRLLERLSETGKPIVFVLMSGSAVSVNWADKHIPAIVQAWYPGGDGGTAVAQLIAGDFSPSGRLPVTFYKSADQLPPFKNYDMAGRTYRYFEGEALYRFGHGLSYTRFDYGKAWADRRTVKAGQAVRVSVDVRNSGARNAAEVVQLYVSRPDAEAPIRSLAAFQRIYLKAGETRRVSFDLDAKALSIVDEKGRRFVAPGKADLWIGGGQPSPGEGGPEVSGATLQLQLIGNMEIAPF
jgi:beta-glucosidase